MSPRKKKAAPKRPAVKDASFRPFETLRKPKASPATPPKKQAPPPYDTFEAVFPMNTQLLNVLMDPLASLRTAPPNTAALFENTQ